ncbi:MAG: monovalent cation:proton antiporter-2 (CPA2) family protein [Myxococcota bacterium]|nr:monovalent cation:proton antiporter-2 (CPA2) family protein [Myxococcota bacterium]
MDLDEFLLATVILLAATAVFVSLFKRLGVGSILGFLAAGVVLGPSGLALTQDVEGLRHFTELGVVLFLFIIGLEMQPSKLWSMRRLLFGLGSLQVLVTGAVLGGYVFLDGVKWQAALILGLGFALSSTAFVMQLLGERGELTSEHGETSLAILLMQDMAIVPLLALVPLLADAPAEAAGAGASPWLQFVEVAGTIAGVALVGRYLIPHALAVAARGRNQEAFVAFALLAALGAAYAMDLVGVSMALGAFLMGMMLSASDYRHQIEASVEPFKGVLIGLFFISVGMSIDLGLLVVEWTAVVRIVSVFLVVKVVALSILCLFFGVGRAAAIRTGFILCQCGEFGFVLFGAAFAGGLLTEGEFGLALMLVTVTMIVTPLMARAGDALAERFGTEPGGGPAKAPGEGLERHVVMAGYGRGGSIIGLMLENGGIPFIAYDIDLDRVHLGRARGHDVHFGDMTNPNVLNGAGLSGATAVIVTLEDAHRAEQVISNVRVLYPSVAIYARARDFEAGKALLERGVSHAVPETVEASIRLGAEVLRKSGVADGDLDALLEEVRRDDYALLQGRPAA